MTSTRVLLATCALAVALPMLAACQGNEGPATSTLAGTAGPLAAGQATSTEPAMTTTSSKNNATRSTPAKGTFTAPKNYTKEAATFAEQTGLVVQPDFGERDRPARVPDIVPGQVAAPVVHRSRRRALWMDVLRRQLAGLHVVAETDKHPGHLRVPPGGEIGGHGQTSHNVAARGDRELRAPGLPVAEAQGSRAPRRGLGHGEVTAARGTQARPAIAQRLVMVSAVTEPSSARWP